MTISVIGIDMLSNLSFWAERRQHFHVRGPWARSRKIPRMSPPPCWFEEFYRWTVPQNSISLRQLSGLAILERGKR